MTITINWLGQSRIVDETRSWNKAHVCSDSFLLVVNSNHGSVSSLSSSADRMHDSEVRSFESKLQECQLTCTIVGWAGEKQARRKTRTRFGDRSFAVAGPRSWNSYRLPYCVVVTLNWGNSND